MSEGVLNKVKRFFMGTPTTLKKALYRLSARSQASRSTAGFGRETGVHLATKEQLETIYYLQPLIFAAVNRFARDCVGDWYEWEEGAPDYIIALEKKWGHILKRELETAIKHALIYGDAYIELIYDGGGDASTTPDGRLLGLKQIDPKIVSDVEDGRLILQPISGADGQFGVKKEMVPERYMRLTLYKLADFTFGLSAIEAAYKVAISLMNADESYGEYVFRSGNGLMRLLIQGASDEDIDEGFDVLENIHKGFVGSDRHQFDVLRPSAFDPTEFNYHFYRSISAVFGMPLSIFIGHPVGGTSTFDDKMQYADYISNVQKTVLTDFVKEFFSRLSGVKNIDWDLKWKFAYTDERTSAEIRRLNASALRMVSDTFGTDFVTKEEVRQLLLLPKEMPSGTSPTAPAPQSESPTDSHDSIEEALPEEPEEFAKKVWSKGAAIDWLVNHGFKHDEYDRTANYHAFRQNPPEKYSRFRMDKDPIGHGEDYGIIFVYGFRKSDGKSEVQSVKFFAGPSTQALEEIDRIVIERLKELAERERRLGEELIKEGFVA